MTISTHKLLAPLLVLGSSVALIACGATDDTVEGAAGAAGMPTAGTGGAGSAGVPAEAGTAGVDANAGTAGADAAAGAAGMGTAGMGTAGMGTAGMGGGPADLCSAPREDDGSLFVETQAENNYTFYSHLEPTVIDVAPNTDLTIDWSALTQDFFGKPLDPMLGIDSVGLVVWKVSEERFKEILNEDDLQASYTLRPAQRFTMMAETSANLFSFQSPTQGEITEEEFLPFLDPVQTAPADHAYTVMPMEGLYLGQGTKAIQMFRLNPDSQNTVVAVTDDSVSLEWNANLSLLTPTVVPAGDPNLQVNWRNMEVNSLGHPFVRRSITRVIVGKYTQTLAELETGFLDLETLATDLYVGNVPAGDGLNLSTLVKDGAEGGAPFPGVDGDGTWIMALTCERCSNPAPWYLTTLETCQ